MCVYAYVSVGDVLAIKITGSGYVKLYFFKIRIKGDTHKRPMKNYLPTDTYKDT